MVGNERDKKDERDWELGLYLLPLLPVYQWR